MVGFKLNIGDEKSKKTFSVNLKSPDADQLLGKKVSSKFRGELLGLTGYELEITGGADLAGFPLRKDVYGPGRKKLLLAGPRFKSPGFKPPKKFRGQRRRKTVHGNTIAKDIVQINCKVTKWGAEPLEKFFKKEEKEEKEKTEEKKEEAKK